MFTFLPFLHAGTTRIPRTKEDATDERDALSVAGGCIRTGWLVHCCSAHRGGTSMTTDVEAGTPVALHAELLAAAGPERVLTLMALRRLLIGTEKAALVEALSQVVREGVTLPANVAASFGVPVGGPVAPSGPDRPMPAPTPDETPVAPQLPAIPAQKAPGPRFTIELGPDSRLDLTALTIRTLRPDPAPSVSVSKPPSRAASDAADSAFEDSSPGRPVFNSLKYYRKVIGRYPLLSREQEVELAQAIEAGLLAHEHLNEASRKTAPKQRRELEQLVLLGEQAFTEFTHSNLRLVVSVAVRYTGRGLDLMDLIQEGNAGMVHAIEMFDYRKGFKFSTYAVQWIQQAIRRAIADQSRTVRLPVYAHDIVAALHKAARELGHQAPADALPAVAERAGMSPDKAADLLSQVRRTIPLEDLTEAIGDDALHEEADRVIRGPHWAEPDVYYRDMSPEEVHTLLNCLTERERLVMTLRHGLDGGSELTLDAIGCDLRVTRERIRQIESKALSKLRGQVHEDRIRANLPVVAPPSAVRRVHRTVYQPGIIVVGYQTIHVGTQWCSKSVTVLIEDDWFRVVDEGRQITAVPRRHLMGSRQIYGITD
ncbi:sigma-70 family RNA polymerase sigma factor [Streptomyces sp. NPDC001652]|uniref:sigma-70 family RNA polymerase sigma factor n=1 Tax=Streptomyces sp. NPDC001652 TaxID=3154393 RepID=UPI0033340148